MARYLPTTQGLRHTLEIGVVAILYALLAQIGLLSTTNPAYGVLFWPAAGLAIAATLLRGRRMVVGVGIGAFAVNFALLLTGVPVAFAAALAVGLAAGAAIQTLIATELFVRWLRPLTVRPGLRDLAHFLAIATAAAAIGSSIAILCLLASGIVPVAHAAAMWATWWLSNVLGIVLFLPVLLLVGQWMKGESIQRLVAPVLFTLVVGLAISLFLLLWQQETAAIETRFAEQTHLAADAIQDAIYTSVHDLDAVHGLFASSTEVSRDEFATYTGMHHTNHKSPGLSITAWVPRVPADARARIEATAQAEGIADFQFVEIGTSGSLLPTAAREVYYPILYSAPVSASLAILGLDLATIPVAMAGLEAARDQGTPHVTGSIPELEGLGFPESVLSLHPVYDDNPPPNSEPLRRDRLHGFAMGLFQIGNILATALVDDPVPGFDLYLLDADASPGQQLLYARPASARNEPLTIDQEITLASLATGLYYARDLDIDGRHWLAIMKPMPGFLLRQRTMLPWLVLTTGLAFAALLAAYLGKRQQTEATLRTGRAELARAQAIAHLGSYTWNRVTGKMQWSDELVCIMGTPAPGVAESFFTASVHPDDRESVATELQGIRKEYPFDLEYRVVRPDGTTRWIRNRAEVASTDAAGAPRQVDGTIQDISEQKAIEEARKRSEAQFRAFFESAVEGIVVADVTGRQFFYANPAICAMFGYTQAEFLECRIPDLHPEEHLAQATEVFEAMVRGELRQATNLPCRRQGGSLFFADVTAALVTLDEETRLVGFFTDVTHRKRTEETLLWEGALLRSLLNSMPDLVFFKNQDSVYLGCNRAFEGLYGVGETDLIGKSDYEFTTPEQAAFFQSMDQAMLRAGAPRRNEEWLSFADGRVRLFDTLKTPLFDPSGRNLGVLGISRDITEQRRAENLVTARLYLSEFAGRHSLEEVLRASVDQAEAITGSHIGFLHFVDEAEGTLHLQTWSTATLKGPCTTAPDVLHYPIANAGIWTRCIQERRAICFNDYASAPGRKGLPPGHTPLTRMMLAPVIRAGNVVAVLGVGNKECDYDDQDLAFLEQLSNAAWEIVLRKQAEDALKAERASLAERVARRTAELSHANATLERAMRAKDEFLANMSHELRTPLNSILVLAESLRDELIGPLNGRQARSIVLIEESGRHLLALINDVLDLAKLEVGKLEIQIDPIVVQDLCLASLAFVKQMAQKKGIHVAYRQSSSDLVMLADLRRLKQVLVNLLSNAVKFTEAGGQVSLEVQTNSVAQTILFAVQDTGIGISRAAQAELFQPFAQLDTGLARRQEGTGLGLALVRNLVDLHGGTVGVESDGVPGHGSRFLVSLPWHQPEHRAAATPVVESVPVPRTSTPAGRDSTLAPFPDATVRKRPVILLAEDNEISLDAFDAFLTSAGYIVVAARTGVEALARAAETDPALILMDVQMPEMDGLEAIRRLRAEPRFSHTPIIALTALAMTGDRERCLAAGADDYLSKPVGLRELVVRIEQVRARRGDGKV